MNIIERAIKRNQKKIEENIAYKRDWREFWEEIKEKKVFLFGVGAGAEYFLKKYGREMTVDGFLDNDVRKHGISVDHFLQVHNFEKKMAVLSPQVLKTCSPDEVVVLVTSLNYFDIITKQAYDMGITQIFPLLLMEMEKYKTGRLEKEEMNDDVLQYYHYAISCLDQPVKKNKMIFHDKGNYSGHGKQITERLLEKKKDLDLVWLVSDMQVPVPDGVRLIYEKDLYQATYEMETAGFWIYDYTVFRWLIKREGQIYIQTKHWASITLKAFGFDEVEYTGNEEYRKGLIHSSTIMDYVFVGSEFDERTCRTGFGFQGEAVYVGSPRSDVLFKENIFKDKVHQAYGIKSQEKILLYAPTWRRINGLAQSQFQSIKIDFERLRDVLKNRFGGEWRILLRLHPDVVIESAGIHCPEYVTDVSYYSDSQELIASADILITDYSSIMFEPAFVMKPVFLYAPDKDEYINKERPLLIEYEALPFPTAETEAELWNCIFNFEKDVYEQSVSSFLNQYGIHEDGHAAERASEFILNMFHANA